MLMLTETTGADNAMTQIETLTHDYAAARESRCALLREMEVEISRFLKPKLQRYFALANAEGDKKAALLAAVAAAPELFERPRSRTLHDIKFGFRKNTGGLTWQDEEYVLRRIHKLYPADVAAAYLHITERPNKEALESLPANELKKLGITTGDTGDVAFVKPAVNGLERFDAAIVDGVVAETLMTA
jgi:hypothetical protein